MKVLLLLLLLFSIASCNVVHVNTSGDLVHWLCKGFLNDSSLVLFNKASYSLNASPGFCIIQNVNNIELKSMTGISSIKCIPKESAGFGFVSVINVTITGIHLVGCGSTLTEEAVVWINDTHPHIGYLQKAVLLFNHCHNINISHITINFYYGYAIMMMNPMGYSKLEKVILKYGKSCFDDSTFSCTGSGIICTFKDTSLVTDSSSYVEIIASNFSYNANIIPNFKVLNENRAEMCHLPLMGAAGLSVIFNQTYKATFLCNKCTIRINLAVTLAVNVLILYTNGMYNSKVMIANSLIAHGSASNKRKNSLIQGSSGITVYSLLCGACNHSHTSLAFFPLLISKSKIKFGGSVVIEFPHVAYGGGTYLNVIETCSPNKFVLQFIDNAFHHNNARISGSQFYAILNTQINNSKVSLILKDNRFCCTSKTYSIFSAYSVIPSITLINWSNVTFDGGKYSSNNSTAIAAYNSQIFLTGKMEFDGNTGVSGSAIFLQSAYLILQEPLNATFFNNKAFLYGGAVYIDNKIIPQVQHRCGIQINTKTKEISDLKVNLTFYNNKAGLAGNALYISQLYNCSKFYDHDMTLRYPDFRWKSIMKFTNKTNGINNGINEVSSKPNRICFCKSNNKIVCLITSTIMKSVGIYTYPGKVIQLSLCAVDASGSIVYSPAIAFIVTGKYEHDHEPTEIDYLYLNQEEKLMPLSGTNPTIVHYKIYSRVNAYTKAFLCIATPDNPPSWCASIRLLPCPLGFILENGQCVCDHFFTQIAPDTKCNITDTSISISSGQWLGNVSNSLGFSFLCPPKNCKIHVSYINVTQPLSLCQDSKEGILCGQCYNGLSVVFGIDQCMECSDLWIISLLGYALSGIILVSIMLYLPLTISEGPLAGIIIVMNLTGASTIDLLEGQNLFLYVTRVIVSIMNLSLGFPLCLYNGMTPVVKTGLLFVYPVYLWVLMIGFIAFSQYSTRVSNRTAMHSVQVLASLMYLSFSKILMTIIDIVAFIPVHTSHKGTMTVWYGDGSVLYLSPSGGHLILFLISVVFLLLFVTPFILFVSFGRLCIRLSCVNKYLRQFLESFQGPYKHNKGYWFGVRVAVLLHVYLMWGILRGYNFKLMLFLQLVPVSVLCCFQLYLKPYRNSLLNVVDSICLAASVFQMILVITFSNDIIPFVIASLNIVIFVGLLTYIFYQMKKKTSYSACINNSRTIIDEVPHKVVDEEEDEMRRFLSNLDD